MGERREGQPDNEPEEQLSTKRQYIDMGSTGSRIGSAMIMRVEMYAPDGSIIYSDCTEAGTVLSPLEDRDEEDSIEC